MRDESGFCVADKVTLLCGQNCKVVWISDKKEAWVCDLKADHPFRDLHWSQCKRSGLWCRKADFIAKLQISLKETAETEYWLRLLMLSDILTEEEAKSLLDDCLEIKRILVASLNTVKKWSPILLTLFYCTLPAYTTRFLLRFVQKMRFSNRQQLRTRNAVRHRAALCSAPLVALAFLTKNQAGFCSKRRKEKIKKIPVAMEKKRVYNMNENLETFPTLQWNVSKQDTHGKTTAKNQ